MPQPDQAAARIDGEVTVAADATLGNGFPAFAGRREAAVVDRHVLRDGKAVVGFHAVERMNVR